ncbi:MAG: ribulose-phosphate 3-epimerase [Bacteroidales bacterium]|nr:ribulose-phosphate 3-epimerase [Bacteroidales bacterium]
MSHFVSPSLLAADFGNLQQQIELLNNSQATWLHLDIMDGVFVPNISFGFPVIKHVKKHAKKPLDVHLMIVDPDRYLSEFVHAGAHVLTVHYEACRHLHRTVSEIRSLGAKAGVSLNPHTPVEVLKEILPDLDLVLIMSVNPGFGGQSFIENSLSKVKTLKQMIKAAKVNTQIEIDGGIDRLTGKKAVDAGVDVLVAGTAIFGAENPVQEIEALLSL